MYAGGAASGAGNCWLNGVIEECCPPDLLLGQDDARAVAGASLRLRTSRFGASCPGGDAKKRIVAKGSPLDGWFSVCCAIFVEPERKANVHSSPRRLAVRDARRRDHGLHRPCPRFSPGYPPAVPENAKREARRQLRLATGERPAKVRRNTGHARTINRGIPCRRQGLRAKPCLGHGVRMTRGLGVERYRDVEGRKVGVDQLGQRTHSVAQAPPGSTNAFTWSSRQ